MEKKKDFQILLLYPGTLQQGFLEPGVKMFSGKLFAVRVLLGLGTPGRSDALFYRNEVWVLCKHETKHINNSHSRSNTGQTLLTRKLKSLKEKERVGEGVGENKKQRICWQDRKCQDFVLLLSPQEVNALHPLGNSPKVLGM